MKGSEMTKQQKLKRIIEMIVRKQLKEDIFDKKYSSVKLKLDNGKIVTITGQDFKSGTVPNPRSDQYKILRLLKMMGYNTNSYKVLDSIEEIDNSLKEFDDSKIKLDKNVEKQMDATKEKLAKLQKERSDIFDKWKQSKDSSLVMKMKEIDIDIKKLEKTMDLLINKLLKSSPASGETDDDW